MAEYIDKTKAVESIETLMSSIPAKDDYEKGYDTAMSSALIAVREVIEADVQPVRHGRWIITDDVEHFIAVCSECGRTEDSRGIKDMPYCHCGARMDGEQE